MAHLVSRGSLVLGVPIILSHQNDEQGNSAALIVGIVDRTPAFSAIMKSHYDTLGVEKSASKAEIKAAFRKLSLETHPDVAQGSANVERFKQISEAHRVLANETERRIYDAEMNSPFQWDVRRNARHAEGAAGFRNGGRPVHHPSFMHAFFDGMGRPRNIALGLTVGCSAFVAISMAFGQNRKPVTDKKARVEAWYNPDTRTWEAPAPWDPTYRKLKPTLQFVPREQVRQRSLD